MIKLLHAADFHLDSPLGAAGPEPAVRRAELRRTAERIFEMAVKENVDLILLAGDLFDGTSPYLGTVEFIKRCIGKAGIPVFISPGNHDFYNERSPYAAGDWPKNAIIFRDNVISSTYVKSLDCYVHGRAFTGPFDDGYPLDGFGVVDKKSLNIVLLHGEVTQGRSRYGAVRPADIERSGADYIALGHIHMYSEPHVRGGTAWAWPGCPEGRGFDETGEKGVIIAEIEKGNTNIRFLPTASRHYFDIEIDAGGSAYPLQSILSALPDSSKNDIFRITLLGESGDTGIDIEGLKAALKDECYSVEIYDKTALRKDIWAGADEDTLRGLFLRELRERLRGAPTPADEQKLVLAARYGLAALDGREPPTGGLSNEN